MRHAGVAIDGHGVDRLDDRNPLWRPPDPVEGVFEKIPKADRDGGARVDVSVPVHVGKPGACLASGKLNAVPPCVREKVPQDPPEKEIVDDEALPVQGNPGARQLLPRLPELFGPGNGNVPLRREGVNGVYVGKVQLPGFALREIPENLRQQVDCFLVRRKGYGVGVRGDAALKRPARVDGPEEGDGIPPAGRRDGPCGKHHRRLDPRMALVDFREDGGEPADPVVALDLQFHELRRDLPDLPGDPLRPPDPAVKVDVPANVCR